MALYQVVAGTRFYIGPAIVIPNADLAAGSFSGSWTEVDSFEQMPDMGEDPNTITASLINRGRDYQQKGTYQAVPMEFRFLIDEDDAGQLACIAAAATNADYETRIVWPSGSQRLWAAQVLSAKEIGGPANTLRMLSVNTVRNSNIVRVAA